MRIRIKYCVPCGYRRHAERLAEKIRRAGYPSVELMRGSFGVFKIWADDRLVFDKSTTRGLLGRLGFGLLPSDEELIAMLKN